MRLHAGTGTPNKNHDFILQCVCSANDVFLVATDIVSIPFLHKVSIGEPVVRPIRCLHHYVLDFVCIDIQPVPPSKNRPLGITVSQLTLGTLTQIVAGSPVVPYPPWLVAQPLPHLRVF